MKRLLIAAVGMLMLIPAIAQETKIGIVDPAYILQNIEKGKEAAKRINDLIQQKNREGQTLQAEIEKLQRELQSPALSPDAQQKKALDLERKKTDLQRFGEDAQREIGLLQQRELQPIQGELMAIIQEIAKSEKYTLILDLGSTQQNSVSNIVHFDESINISKRVAEIYNQRFPLAAKAPAAAAQPPVKK